MTTFENLPKPEKYRSKIVEIEAMKWDGSVKSADAIEGWSHGATSLTLLDIDPPAMAIQIQTPEGTMAAKPGDYIVKGTIGEFYPVKPGVFEAKYERIEGDALQE